MSKYAMLIDVNECIGCYACRVACQTTNDLPSDISRIKFMEKEKGTFPETEIVVLPTQCMHCDEPACVDVCPTGASFKNEDGLVLIDYDKCIGCKYCITACPYDARTFNTSTGKVDKCNFCAPRVQRGMQPACVEACVNDARFFGEVDDSNSPISKLIAEADTAKVGGTSFYYKLPEGWDESLPEDAIKPAYVKNLTERVHPAGKALLGLSAGAVAASYVMTRVNGGHEDEE